MRPQKPAAGAPNMSTTAAAARTRRTPQLLALALVGAFTACTAVTIEEKNAFDRKRTVSEKLLQQHGVRRSEISVPVGNGLTLSAWHLDRPDDRGTLVYFGGNGYLMVNGHDILQGILKAPVDVFTVDYRGYGQSGGEPSVAALKSDALRVLDYVRGTLGVPTERIAVHGQSLGSFVALFVASERPVAGVILEAPVSNVDALLGHLAPWWTRLFLRFEVDERLRAEDNLERIAQIRTPLLILSGEKDRVAHPDMARALFARAKTDDKRLELFEDGHHNDLPLRADYAETHTAFLKRVLPPDGVP